MNLSPTSEQALLVSSIRRYVDRELAPLAADADRAAAPPQALLAQAGELGFFLDAVPEEFDGLCEDDYSHTDRALRGFELARGCPAIAALLEANVEPALAVAAWGSDAAKRALFTSLGDGGTAALAHDHAGRLEVSASGSDVVVKGELPAVVALDGASHLLVIASDGDGPVLALLDVAAGEVSVDAAPPSAWRAARWGRASVDARVPADRVLGRGEDAKARASDVLAWARLSLAARAVGAGGAAVAHARGYAEERVQFRQPIARFESIDALADRNEIRLRAARWLVIEAAAAIDSGAAERHGLAATALAFAAEKVGDATIDAVQIYGGYGFVNDFPVEKLMRDSRPFAVLHGEPTLLRAVRARGDKLAGEVL